MLKSFYELLVDDILEAIKKGNEQSYSFLTACFTATFPSINPDTVDWKSFKKNLESIPKEDLAVHKKAFVTNLLERPDPHFFFILSLAEYDA